MEVYNAFNHIQFTTVATTAQFNPAGPPAASGASPEVERQFRPKSVLVLLRTNTVHALWAACATDTCKRHLDARDGQCHLPVGRVKQSFCAARNQVMKG
jgi:hypothetical protein